MKTKVIRGPRKPAAGKLAPLIAGESPHIPDLRTKLSSLTLLLLSGVIERRRQARRTNTAEFVPSNGQLEVTIPSANRNTAKSGFDKVKLRGGGVPERRITSTGNQTPRTSNNSPDSSAFHIPPDERQPLLGSSNQ